MPYQQDMALFVDLLQICPCNEQRKRNIAVFSEKTDVPHLPRQSMVAISVMKLWTSKN